MIVKKTLSIRAVYEFAGYHLWWLSGWMLLVTGIYYFTHWQFLIPGVPLALIGTAVAFYVGFKNSHSYDRLWGGIVIWNEFLNDSRKFASMLKHYRADEAPADDDSALIRRQIIFRHIAYLYLLREQLLEPTEWEHVSLNDMLGVGRSNRRRRNRLNKLYKEELEEVTKRHYLSEEERSGLTGFNNKAAQLLDKQTEMIQLLYERKTLNMIHQTELQDTISRFYETQGNAERIKLSPFPRKYATFSYVFICIFIFLLPFGIIGEFSKLGDVGFWLSIPVGVIVGWVYIAMETIADYSENPFEGLHNDAPMLAVCRTVEIDLLEMFGEQDVPLSIQPKDDVLL